MGPAMTAVLTEQVGVAAGAASWQVAGYRLWQSTVPEVLLYVPTELSVARDTNGQQRAAVTERLRWQQDAYTVTGGSAVLGLFADVSTDVGRAHAQELEWTQVVRHSGYTFSQTPRFLPMPMRDVRMSAAFDPAHVSASSPETEGESRTLVVDLTAAGAQAWSAAIRDKAPVLGGVRLSYSYPQLMAPALASVRTHGIRIYTELAAQLTRATDGSLYGSLDAIRVAWASLVSTGAVEVTVAGATDGDPAASRDDLVDQVREQLFDIFFVPHVPGDAAGGCYALRWRRAADVPDLPITIRVEGWTWLTAAVDASLGALLRSVDDSHLHTSYEQVSLPVTVAVEPSTHVTAMAVSLSFGDAHPPEAPTFDHAGGTRQYLASSERPENLIVSYRATVSFEPTGWPVVESVGTLPLTSGAFRLVLRPAQWLRRHTAYLYVRHGDRLVGGLQAELSDYLTVTATYTGPGLAAPVRTAARITPQTPIEFSYPVLPSSEPGRVTLNAVGMVGGRLISGSELEVQEAEDAVYLLVDGSRVQVVGRNAVLPESDTLADRLRTASSRPVVSDGVAPVAEDDRRIDLEQEVFLIPQPTDVSCWAAALAMVVSAREQASVLPESVAAAAGMDVDTGYGWNDIRNAVRAWDLVEEGPRSSPPEEWARLLYDWGPIWIVEVGAPYHAVVVGGVWGDGTPDGTWVKVYNPWPPQVGVVEWKTFLDFDWEFGLGAGAGAAMVHASR